MGKKHKNTDKLSPAEIEEFKAMLLAKRKEILGNVISMEDETLRRENSDLSSMPIHMADLGTDNYDLENTLYLVESERKILAEIDEALFRIEEGSYGICEGSGKQILKPRLEAIPWARYCVDYAGLLEKGLVAKEYSYETDSEDQIDEEQDDNIYSAEE